MPTYPTYFFGACHRNQTYFFIWPHQWIYILQYFYQILTKRLISLIETFPLLARNRYLYRASHLPPVRQLQYDRHGHIRWFLEDMHVL